MGRSTVGKRYRGAWAVLFASALVGGRSILDFLGASLIPPGVAPDDRLGVNYAVYHRAAEAALAGEDFYDVTPPGFGDLYTYLYPPITVLAYVPFAFLEPLQGYLVHTTVTVAACTAATVGVVSLIERAGCPLGRVDVAGIWLFVVASIHSAPTIYFGNVNLLLAAAVVGGVLALERGRETRAGVAFGAVALVKLFPALVGLYLLRVRARRAVGAATATGLGGLAAGAIVFGPSALERYVDAVLARGDAAAFVGGYPPDGRYYVTVQRPLSHAVWTVAPDAPAAVLPVAAALVLAPLLAYCYLGVETGVDRLVALHATLAASVLVVPSLRPHLVVLFVSWIPLLYTLQDRPGGRLFVAGSLIAAVAEYPDEIAAAAAGLPEPLETVAAVAATLGTLQLYGLLATLAACAWYKRSRGVGRSELLEAWRTWRREIERGLSSVFRGTS